LAVRRYEFGPPEDQTLVAGLRASQLFVVATSLLLAVGIVRSSGSSVTFAGALAVITVGGVIAFWNIGGRTVEQWVPVAVRWSSRRVRGQTRYTSAAPLFGHVDDEATPSPPDTLAGVRIIAERLDGAGTVGIVHDRQAGTYAALLAVRGRSFQLADVAEQERRLAAWGAVLAGLARARSPIHRLQWVERTVPDDGDAMGRYLSRAVRVGTGHSSLSSYLELVDHAGPVTQQHETLLAVSISAAKARRHIRQAGGRDAGAAKVLMRELLSLRRELASADIIVDGALTPRLVARAFRTGFEPNARAGIARRAAAAGDSPGTSPANAWPLATETVWGAYRVADVWHATYWIAHWPRTSVGADFFAPLLLGTTAMRTVSLTMEPISPLRAHRDVEQQAVKGLADDELRSRAGFRTSARRLRERQSVDRRERELADGHADYRLAGYVTVTAASGEHLEAACGEVEQAAQQSFLELRRLYGQQDSAFTYTLPLCRGLS
jgi:hypothetical protein